MHFSTSKKFLWQGLWLLLLFFSKIAVAEHKDTLMLDEFVVSASRTPVVYSEAARLVHVLSREDIKNLPVQSFHDILDYFPGVDLRRRGSHGVQADLSVRGGTFEQYAVLINGIKINDPQTGHHSLNIPISLHDIERIEVLAGPGSRVFGANAFTGAINIITVSDEKTSASAEASYGEYGLHTIGASISGGINKGRSLLSYGYSASDGFVENTDFNMHNLFWHGGAKTGLFKVDVQAGYQNKAFGANSFYSPAFPEQFEHTRTKLASIKAETGNNFKVNPVVYWRRHHDRFELFRNEKPQWYQSHNYHQTDVYGAEINSHFTSVLGKTAFGVEYRLESIMSNVLGDPTGDSIQVKNEKNGWFTHQKSRENFGAYAEHTLYIKSAIVSAGAFCHYNSDYGLQWYPGIDIAYLFSESLQWYSSYNHTLRIPTFTDLYYEGPNNIGNPDLLPEKAVSVETGVKHFGKTLRGSVSVFYRDASNVIDWVKRTDNLLWESKNITNVKTAGIEANANISLKNIFGENTLLHNLRISYSYISVDKNAENYISNYALDFLKHKLTAEIRHEIFKNINAHWAFRYKKRNGSYYDYIMDEVTAYKSFWLMDLKVLYLHKNIELFVEATNLFNVEYVDFGNIFQPGRWIKGGFVYRL